MTVPVLLGSTREGGHGTGLAQLLIEQSHALLIDARPACDLLPPDIDLRIAPMTDGSLIAAQVKDSSGYQDGSVRQWSRLVTSSKAVIILTPQYNWSYSGPLKFTIDHLYH